LAGLPILEIVASIIGALAFLALLAFAAIRWRNRANRRNQIIYPLGMDQGYEMYDLPPAPPAQDPRLRRRTPERAMTEYDIPDGHGWR
jgi:hypothetical protein